MITDVHIVDYQALRQVDLDLGRFTVVTGPTGSGKSAVIRAIKLAAFNARGTSYIRRGAKSCAVGLGFREEQTVVAIHRGTRGADKYVVSRLVPVPARDAPKFPMVTEFTKLAGGVPDQVREILKLSELNFAGQFDRPYLLDATGGQVARVLGQLTNVTVVFEAAAEAERRRRETNQALKRVEQELESLKEQALKFRGLKERRAAAAEAGDRLASMGLIGDSLARIRALLAQWQGAEAARAAAQRRLAALEVPSADRLDALRQQLHRLYSLQETLRAEYLARRQGSRDADEAEQAEGRAHAELHALLAAAGVCPTCGQEVRGLCLTRRRTNTARTS